MGGVIDSYVVCRRLCLAALVLSFILSMFLVVEMQRAWQQTGVTTGTGINHRLFLSKVNHTMTARRLLASPDDHDIGNNDGSLTRIGSACSKDDIVVFQGPTTPLPSGIPTYTVQIQNVCLSGSCSISNIHLSCGWFSSARLINPRVFRRISYDNCLVNDGGPLSPGGSISFQYANSFPYHLSVSSVAC